MRTSRGGVGTHPPVEDGAHINKGSLFGGRDRGVDKANNAAKYFCPNNHTIRAIIIMTSLLPVLYFGLCCVCLLLVTKAPPASATYKQLATYEYLLYVLRPPHKLHPCTSMYLLHTHTHTCIQYYCPFRPFIITNIHQPLATCLLLLFVRPLTPHHQPNER